MHFSPAVSSALLPLLNVRIHLSVLKHLREIQRAICARQTLQFTFIILPQTESKQVKSRNVTKTERPSLEQWLCVADNATYMFQYSFYLFIYLCFLILLFKLLFICFCFFFLSFFPPFLTIM